MATVFIRDLQIGTIIGICEWEQAVAQTLHVDIEMELTVDQVATSDDLAKGVDYADLASQFTDFVRSHKAKLLESLLHDALRFVLRRYAIVEAVSIEIRKPQYKCLPLPVGR